MRGFTVAGRALHGIAVMGVPGKEIMKGEKHMSLHFNSVWQLGTPRKGCLKSTRFQKTKGYSDRDVFLDFIVFLGEGKQTQSAPTPSARNCQKMALEGTMVFPEMKGAKKSPTLSKKQVRLVGGFLTTHLKNMRKSNWIISQKFRGKNKKISETTT